VIHSFWVYHGVVLTLALVTVCGAEWLGKRSFSSRVPAYLQLLVCSTGLLVLFWLARPFGAFVECFLGWYGVVLPLLLLAVFAWALVCRDGRPAFVGVLNTLARVCSPAARQDLDAIVRDLKRDARELQERGRSVGWYLLVQVCVAVFRTVIVELTAGARQMGNAFPPQAAACIGPSEALVERFEEVIAKKRKLMLTGRSGSGKTTFAMEMHRRYLSGESEAPAKQTPVLVRLSRVRSGAGIACSVLDQIAQDIGAAGLFRGRFRAKRMLSRGSLLLILDDLEYLDRQGLQELERFIRGWERNSYLCLVNEPPNHSFWEGIERITMPDWEPADVETYIRARISDSSKASGLIDHLTEVGALARGLTPVEWRFIVDAYLEGRIYELFHLSVGEPGYGRPSC
jgi:hypothetical protein